MAKHNGVSGLSVWIEDSIDTRRARYAAWQQEWIADGTLSEHDTEFVYKTADSVSQPMDFASAMIGAIDNDGQIAVYHAAAEASREAAELREWAGGR